MSKLFQFETNIEQEVANFLTQKGILTFPTRGIVDLSANNVQVALEYNGAMDATRQVVGKFHEYDLHEGSLAIQIQTFRQDDIEHHNRIGKIRSLMLNGNNGFKSNIYTIFDLMPESATHSEQAENNLDQSLLSYSIKWKMDFNKLNNN